MSNKYSAFTRSYFDVEIVVDDVTRDSTRWALDRECCSPPRRTYTKYVYIPKDQTFELVLKYNHRYPHPEAWRKPGYVPKWLVASIHRVINREELGAPHIQNVPYQQVEGSDDRLVTLQRPEFVARSGQEVLVCFHRSELQHGLDKEKNYLDQFRLRFVDDPVVFGDEVRQVLEHPSATFIQERHDQAVRIERGIDELRAHHLTLSQEEQERRERLMERELQELRVKTRSHCFENALKAGEAEDELMELQRSVCVDNAGESSGVDNTETAEWSGYIGKWKQVDGKRWKIGRRTDSTF